MGEESGLVTVFRSADNTADLQANEVFDLLLEAGLAPEIFDENAPGVVAGVYEVRVPGEQVATAEQLIAAAERGQVLEAVNPSPQLDLVTVWASNSNDADMEILAVKGLLEASGIDAVIVGASQYPNLPFELRVAKEQREAAEQLISEAAAGGAGAADEAERETERG